MVRGASAAEVETAVADQVWALLRQPEVVVGTWLAARVEVREVTERQDHELVGGPAEASRQRVATAVAL